MIKQKLPWHFSPSLSQDETSRPAGVPSPDGGVFDIWLLWHCCSSWPEFVWTEERQRGDWADGDNSRSIFYPLPVTARTMLGSSQQNIFILNISRNWLHSPSYFFGNFWDKTHKKLAGVMRFILFYSLIVTSQPLF